MRAFITALSLLAIAPSAALAQTRVAATAPGIRYEGHWDLSGSRATTVNSGSRMSYGDPYNDGFGSGPDGRIRLTERRAAGRVQTRVGVVESAI